MSLRKFYFISILLIYLISLISCVENEPLTTADYQYPLKVDNSWTYQRISYSYNFDPDSMSNNDTIFDTVNVTIGGLDTLADSAFAYRFETTWNTQFGSSNSIDHYNNTDSGYYKYTYQLGKTGPPKIDQTEIKSIKFHGIKYNSIDEFYFSLLNFGNHSGNNKSLDSINYYIHPRKQLTYPLTVGNQWTVCSVEMGDEINIDRKIVSIEKVTIPLGVFDCFKIRTYWDMDDDGEWDTDIEKSDFLAPIGYIISQINIRDLVVTDYSGHSVSMDMTEKTELTGRRLNGK